MSSTQRDRADYLEATAWEWARHGAIAIFAGLLGGPIRLFVFGCLAIVLAAWIPSAPPESRVFLLSSPFWHEFLIHLGTAFWIATAIAVAIERVSRDRQVQLMQEQAKRQEEILSTQAKAVGKNALSALFEADTPAAWLQYIKDILASKKFYREKPSVHFVLRMPTDRELEKMRAKCRAGVPSIHRHNQVQEHKYEPA